MMRSLFSAISGLKGHQTMMDVVGNNISNVNSTAFKASRITFQDIISQTLRGAQAPSATQGGLNPMQIGLGVQAFQALLGTTATNGVSQTQDVDVVQASPAAAPPVATQIADGALIAARRIGQTVEMILQPEGLGSISLRVTAERAGLAVHMAVDNPQAREMVQATWPQLQQALQERGLTVQSMLLDLSNGRGNGQAFQAFQQFNGQQQFAGQQARGGAANADRHGSLTVDEGAGVQSSAAAATRVDYRI